MEQSEHDLAESRLAKPAAPPEPRDAGPVFTTKNVSIYYSSFKAVADVSMTIYENDITAFIGSSGSGKTTVLRAFNRMNDLVPGARMDGEIDYRGGVALRARRLPGGGAAAHRHGLPEAQPVPEVDI